MITIFSVANEPYLGYLKTLHASIKRYLPNSKFIGFLVDCKKDNYDFDARHIQSDEKIPVNNFCAGLRTRLFVDLLEEINTPLLYIDADSIFVNEADSLIEHINSCGVSMRPKNLDEGTFASGVISCNPNKLINNFFQNYKKNYLDVLYLGDWFSDQKMLNKTYQEMKDKINFKPLPNKFCDVWFSEEGIIWTAKGRTRNNQKFINKLEEYNYVR